MYNNDLFIYCICITLIINQFLFLNKFSLSDLIFYSFTSHCANHNTFTNTSVCIGITNTTKYVLKMYD